MGFYGKLAGCTSLEAELWGIFRGLNLVVGQDLSYVDIQAGLEVVVNLIRRGSPPNFPLKSPRGGMQSLVSQEWKFHKTHIA